jgi:hypothetical protein
MSKTNFKIETKIERFMTSDDDDANVDGIKKGDTEA